MIWRRFFKGFNLCFARTHAEHRVVFTSFFNFLTQTINLLGTELWLRIMFELGHKDHPIIHTSPEELLREMFLSWKEEHRFFLNYPSLRKGDKKLSIRHRGALSGCGERSQWKLCLQERTDLLFCTGYTNVLGPREVNCEVCLCQHFKILLNTKQLEVIELRGNGLEFWVLCTVIAKVGHSWFHEQFIYVLILVSFERDS